MLVDNQNGDRAATISTSSSLYHRFNRDDRLNQRPVTMPSVASLYSSLNTDMKGDTVDIIIVHTLVCILHR